jgi:hypothetical protein
MNIPTIKYELSKKNFPEGEALLEKHSAAKKALQEIEAEILETLKKAPLGAFLTNFAPGKHSPLHLRPGHYGSGLAVHIQSYDISQEYIVDPNVDPMHKLRQGLSEKTLNSLINGKLLTDSQKKVLLGIPDKLDKKPETITNGQRISLPSEDDEIPF